MSENHTPSGKSPEEKARLLLERLTAAFNLTPFNSYIGFEITEITPELARGRFSMKPHLVGNVAKQILHGGVIASALDAIGGATGIVAAYQKMQGEPRDEKMMRVTKFGTIDMRIDYLQPGRGEWFEATGSILRIGKKVCVTRMELHNNEGELIAVGTGTYLY